MTKSSAAIYHYHLGLAYAKSNEAARARTSIEHALELKPDFQGADEARKVLASLVG
jgi:Tfp pilus assembly protein PilF